MITPEQFCYWLKGFMEVADPSELNCTQTQIIKDHLDEVFNKVTPDRKVIKSELPEGLPEGFKNNDFSSRRLC